MKNLVTSKIKLVLKLKRLFSLNSNTIELIAGTVLAQIISIFFTPLLTRIFSPEVFGQAGVIISIVGILSSVICLRLEYAIVIPINEDEAQSIFSVACYIALLMSIISIVIIIIVKFFFVTFLIDLSSLYHVTYLIPFILFLTGLNNSLSFLLSRWGKYTFLSISRVITAITFSLSSIIFAFIYEANTSARIISYLLSILLSVCFLLISTHSKFKLTNLKFSIKTFRNVFSTYKSFTTYDVFANLINSLSWQIVPILLLFYFSDKISGYYNLSLRMIQLPMSMVGSAISQVFFVNTAKYVEERTLVKNINRLIKNLLLIGILPMMVIALFSPYLFNIIFGQEWREAGVYSQILSIWAFIWFIANPVGMVLVALRQQKTSLIIQIINLGTRYFSIYYGSVHGDVKLALILFSVSGILVYGFVIIYSYYISFLNDKKQISI